MNSKTYVWDPFIRVFHWSLVVAFITAYLTGDEENMIHVYAGYYILGAVTIRILWGLVGTQHARFKDFIYSPVEVISYLKGFITGDSKKYTGHNPAGGLMVIMMLVSLIMTGLSGLKVYGLEGYGPLADSMNIEVISSAMASDEREHDFDHKYKQERDDDEQSHKNQRHDEHEEDDEAEELWEEIHEFFADLTVLLVFLHIAGVILSSLRHHENLIKAMFTGYK